MTGSSRSLHRIVYHSRQTPAVMADLDLQVRKIIQSSIHNNRIDDLTGLLITIQGCFLQVLEGPATAVRTAYGRILNDDRHTEVAIIHAGPAEQRLFADWNMCARAIAPSDQEILDVIDSRGAFEPGRLTAKGAIRLLTTVADIQRRTVVTALTG